MIDLVILGTAGNSLEILDAVIAGHRAALGPQYRPVGFLDDNPQSWGASVHGVPVLGGLAKARQIAGASFINGIGSTASYRRKPAILDGLGLSDDRFATVTHPSAVVSTFARIGAGTALLQNVVICSGASIGRHVQVLPLSVVSHDAQIEDYATIAGGVCLSGFVSVGRASYVGSNASVRERITIGAEALVGMGSVVLRDVAPGAVVAGSPAKEIRRAIT